MANDSEFIEGLSDAAYKNLVAYNAELMNTVKNVKAANTEFAKVKTPTMSGDATAKLMADYKKQELAVARLQTQLEKLAQAQAQTAIKNIQLKEKEVVAIAKADAAILKQLAAEDRVAAKKLANAEKERLINEKKIAADQKATELAIRNAKRKEAADAKAYAKFEKDFAKYEADLEKEGNAYYKIETKIKALTPEYTNLAAKRELGVKLSADEARRLDFLTGKLTGYQNILKKVDADMGRHQREVGNYAKANSNLSNSIGQISRELPNFGQSFSVGVLSLTNNVGALLDSVKQVKAQNKDLAAQGQQTKSVLSQVLGAVVSWQTALFIGIGIFSAYSKEIGEWASELWNGKRVLDELYKSQNDFNDARLKSSGKTKQEIENIQEFIKIAKNANGAFSTDQQLAAFQKIRPLAKGYFDDLKDGELTTAKGAIALEKFTKALEAQGRAQDLLSANLGTKDRINQLQAESDARKKYFDDQKAIILALEARQIKEEEFAKRKKILDDSEDYRRSIRKKKEDAILEGGQEGKFAVGTGNFTAKYEDTRDIQTAISKLRSEELKQRAEINKEIEASVVLEGKLNSAQSEGNAWNAVLAARIRFLKELTDASRAVYEAEKLRREIQISDLSKIANDEKKAFSERIEAYGEMLQKKQDLLLLTNSFENQQVQKQKDTDISESQKALSSELKQAKGNASAQFKIREYYRKENEQINKKYDAIFLKNSEQYNDDYLSVVEESAKAELEIIHKRDEILLSTDKIYRDQQIDTFKKVADNEKLSVEIRQEAFRAYIALKQKQIDIDKSAALAAAGNNEEEIRQIKLRYQATQELLNLEKATESPIAKRVEQADAAFQSLFKTLRSNMFSDAGLSSLEKFFDGSFKNVMAGFNDTINSITATSEEKAQAIREKFAVTYSAIADSVQEAFELINASQQSNFDAQYNRLEQQKNIALAFEGQTAEGRAEIERQYEDKRRAIAARQAQAEKRTAIFNTIINTSQAIVATLAKTPLPAGLPFVIATAALGAVQLAAIAATPIPQFYKGTDNAPGGLAWTQEQGREIITDKHDRVKSTGSNKGAQLTWLEKGDKVKTAAETREIFNRDLDRVLVGNGIMPMAATFASAEFKNNGNTNLTAPQVESAMRNAIQSMPVGDTIQETRDDLGYARFKVKQGIKREQTNNQKYMKGVVFTNKRG